MLHVAENHTYPSLHSEAITLLTATVTHIYIYIHACAITSKRCLSAFCKNIIDVDVGYCIEYFEFSTGMHILSVIHSVYMWLYVQTNIIIIFRLHLTD